jgi:hypothetical protein
VAFSQWQETVLYLSLDTTMLWNEYCIIRVSVIYRGRAVPVVWRVLAHQSSSVAFAEYKNLLNRLSHLLPPEIPAILLADRGFVDTKLMEHCEQLGWKYRIRIKQDFWVCRPGKAPCQVRDFRLGLGVAVLLQGVKVTKMNPYGPVSLAFGRESTGGQLWAIVSNEPTTLQTFREYGLRFDIEESFQGRQVQWLSVGEFRSSLSYGSITFMLGAGNSHSFFDGSGNSGCSSRKAPLGRPSLAPWQ